MPVVSVGGTGISKVQLLPLAGSEFRWRRWDSVSAISKLIGCSEGDATSKELMNGSWGPYGIVFITDFNHPNGLLPSILYVSLQMFRK